MVLSVIMNINNKLKFLYRKNRFLTPTLRRLLCNTLIQPHFDYAYSAWYPNLTKKLKNKIQTSQNKFIRFCPHLDKLTHITHEEFEILNWSPVTGRFNQCINSIVFKYVNDQCQMALSYIGPTIRSKTPDLFKRANNLNTFKHNLKKHYLKELKNLNSS